MEKNKKSKKKIINRIIKVVAFTLIFAVLLSYANLVLSIGMDRLSYHPLKGFYEEPENSLDAVYIGSSNALAFWNSLIAWKDYGITVYSFSSNAQPLSAAEFMIKEARKTQPDAKFIVNINALAEDDDLVGLYRIYDYTPFSLNKVQSINKICDLYDLSSTQKLGYYFPIVQFHDRWEEINGSDFNFEVNSLKSANKYSRYIEDSNDVSEQYNISNELIAIPEALDVAITDLLDYCDKEKLDVTFVAVPQAKDVEFVGQYNTIGSKISERGYDFIDFINNPDELGVDTNKDFYNIKHTNIHGSLKYTYYMSEYLIDKYGFKDKRGNEEYSDWDKCYSEYTEIINKAVLDFELEPSYDPSILSEPQELSVQAKSDKIALSWNAVEGAKGYAIYERKGTDGAWKAIGETTELTFNDKKFDNKKEYYYRVVAFTVKNGNKAYGDFSYKGISVTAK